MKSLTDVLPFAISRLVDSASSTHVVVVLIDGLGFENILEHANVAPDWLRDSSPIQSTFPSTTPVSLMSLGTAVHAGRHGMLGATVKLDSGLLQPLHWQDSPAPQIFQPFNTVFENAVQSGIAVTRSGPAAYAGSGLTRAALRGGVHVAAENLSELLVRIQEFLKTPAPGLMYAYYPQLDKIGHVHGVCSEQWRQEYVQVMKFFIETQQSLGSKQDMIVTADHGMVDVENRLWIEDLPHLTRDMAFLAGEPRMRHVYAQPGDESSLFRGWQRLEEFADVYTRDEFIQKFFQGDIVDEYRSRVGDVVAVARGLNSLGSRNVDSKVSQLIGMHGADSVVETSIPAAVVSG